MSAVTLRTYICQTCNRHCTCFVPKNLTPPAMTCADVNRKQKWRPHELPPTEAQLLVISHITNNIGIHFKGKTRYEAHSFIKANIDASRNYARTHDIRKKNVVESEPLDVCS